MTKQSLSNYFSLNRRYSRSINLERDFEIPNAVLGYVLTERAMDAFRRIFSSIVNSHTPEGEHKSANRAWTLTGVYGTGKSAFAHYLTSLSAPADSLMRRHALDTAQVSLGKRSQAYRELESTLPEKGFFRAVAVGQREPMRYTIIRALAQGAEVFWSKGRKPDIIRQLTDWATEIETDHKTEVTNAQTLDAVKKVAEAAKTDVLLIIDELGKNLEFAAHNPEGDDLYLLQQLAELPRKSKFQVYVVGLLHQSFAEYSQRLASSEKSEWAKIQGRFEDIPFTESTEQMTRLIGQAIDRRDLGKYEIDIQTQAQEWRDILKSATDLPEISPSVLDKAYPLHPIAALVLPMLCVRYAQNDRSLFTFLTSSEPYAFTQFLEAEMLCGNEIPTLKIHQIYDYFVESVGSGMGSRPNLQRWIEIQGLIADARHLDEDTQLVLKTIGILNLITSTGAFRATRTLVKLALMGRVGEKKRQQHWDQVIESLLTKGLITHRKQLDELRIWEGSDFDVEKQISDQIETNRSPLAGILTLVSPLKPLIAQRHSYRTGTLRYFERQYLETPEQLESLLCKEGNGDGLIGYWLNQEEPKKIPTLTVDGKPFILLTGANFNVLKARAQDFAALKKIQSSATQLQNDGVARREVRHRLVQAKRLLDESLSQTFRFTGGQTVCWIQGKQQLIHHTTDFNAELSKVCDRVYSKTPILWNELINRRELTSQGAKARRELIEAMLDRSSQARLGLEGYGPEVAMYYSVLEETNIHRLDGDEWNFQPPSKKSGIQSLWQAIEDFYLASTDKIQTLDLLYQRLEAPPYGVKRGVIPVLLTAVLAYHCDDVSIYKDGTFIPVLSSEHFELLVKDPSRYGIKYVEVTGLRAQVFRELELALRGANVPVTKAQSQVRNATLLSVVKPLFNFVKRLPPYTIKTKSLGKEAQAVLKTLKDAQEPDHLIFKLLPEACGLPAVSFTQSADLSAAKVLRKKLVQSLQEIQNAYDKLLSECQAFLYSAFGVREEQKLREDLRVRSGHLVGQCVDPLLKRFTLAAVEGATSDREWTEALVMIVADKPAESWSDEDATAFQIKLSDLARRFKNLEALRSEAAASNYGGFEARRVTITRSNGQEMHRMVWLDHEQEDKATAALQEFQEKLDLYDDPQFRQVLVAMLAERNLGVESQNGVAQLPTSTKSRKNGEKGSQTHSRTVGREG